MTLAENLKTSTRSYHDSAEGSQFQATLAKGDLPLPLYGRYLGQLFLVHDALEKTTTDHAKGDARLSDVFSKVEEQVPFLKEDLEVLGLNPAEAKPLASTKEFLDIIRSQAEEQPVSLLGIHYVLLGSKHGGKFIAKNLKQHHGFNGSGTRYFDPYGDEFVSHWKAFIARLNEISVDEKETEQLMKAAQKTFVAVGSIGDELDRK